MKPAVRALMTLVGVVLFCTTAASAQTVTLSGTVFGGGTPLPNTLVEALTNGTTTVVAKSMTNASGQYSLALAASTYDLRITPPAGSGFTTETVQDVEVLGDRQYDVILLSSGPSGLSGRVFGHGGAVVSGVAVRALTSNWQLLAETKTDAEGRYSLPIGDGTIILQLHRSGPSTVVPHWFHRTQYNVTVSGKTTLDVKLAVVKVSGIVTAPTGEAVAGASIEVSTSGNQWDQAFTGHWNSSNTVSSGESGAYQTLLLAGTATFIVRPPAGVEAATLNESVPLTGDVIRDFALRELTALTGTVRGHGGAAVGGATVRALTSNWQQLGQATTDAEGRYSLSLGDGTIILQVHRSGVSTVVPHWFHRTQYNVKISGDTTLDVNLPVVKVSGTVTAPSGEAVASASIEASASGNQWDQTFNGHWNSSTTVSSTAAGTYQTLLLAGNATFIVRPPAGLEAATLSENAQLTGDVIREFRLKELTTLSGTVRGIGGVGVSGVTVRAMTSNWQLLRQTTTDAAGHYSLPIGDGTILLQLYRSAPSNVVPSWFHRTQYNVTINGNTTYDVVLPVVRINGGVTDSNGVPVEGVVIRADANGNRWDTSFQGHWNSNGTTRSDPRGQYSLLLLAGNGNLQIQPSASSGFSSAAFTKTFTGNLTQRVVLQLPDAVPPVIVSGPTVVHLSDTSVSVSWTTNEPATSRVEFGIDGLTLAVSSRSLTTTHGVTLTGLTPKSKYIFRVASSDGAWNGPTYSKEGTFSTQPEPGDIAAPLILSGPSVISVTNTSAIVHWTTDEPATSRVDFGTSSNLGSTVASVPGEFSSSHTMTLGGLTPTTTYYARVYSEDPDGNGTWSSIITFTTAAEPDTTPPIISNIEVTAVTHNSITVSWQTNEAATSAASYNNGTVFHVAADPALVTWHQITLAGLSAGSTYAITVSSKDAAGNGPTLSAPFSATTLAGPDVAPPKIFEVAIKAGKTTALVSWSTDEPATSEVLYGTIEGSPDGVAANLSLTKAHGLELTGLSPATTYYTTIRSVDASGNAATIDLKVTTLAADAQLPPTAPSPLTVSQTPNNTGSFVLTWGASTDDGPGGVESYEIFRNGESIALVAFTETSYAETGLPAGTYLYGVRAADYDGLYADSAELKVIVDLTAPVIEVPALIETPATTAVDAIVNYTATATDDLGTPTLMCVPSSGSPFKIGDTEVACTATDAAGNGTKATFTVRVTDPFAPVITVPSPIKVEATSPDGIVIHYTVTVSDNADPSPEVGCEPSSGSVFPIGETTVMCVATDASRNRATASFKVTVTAPPRSTTTSALAVSPETPAYGDLVTLTATVTAAFGTPAGDVEFLDGTTLLGRAALSGSTAVLSTKTLAPGAHSLSARYVGTLAHEPSASRAMTLDVAKAKPVITVVGGTSVYDGTPRSAAGTVRGVDDVDLGVPTFTYNGQTDLPVNAGTYDVVASFAGDQHHSSGTATAVLVIAKATPQVTWAAPAPIVYGTALGAQELNATAGVSGTFTYQPSAGTILGAKAHTLSAMFTPADTANYLSVGDPADGTGTLSVALEVLKAKPQISVAPATETYNAGPHSAAISAKGGAGETLDPLSVTYNGSTELPVGADRYEVIATFAGDANHDAGSASGTLTILKAKPVISITAGTFTYDAQPHVATGQVNGVVSEDLGAPTFTYSGSPDAPVNAGSYEIVASYAGSANYEEGAASATLVIQPAPLRVTGNDATRTYGASNPEFTVTYEGFVGGEDSSVLGGTLSFFQVPPVEANVGEHPIRPTGLLSSNYEVTYAAGTLTVTPAPLTVTANDATREFGTSNPEFSVSYGGFVLNQDPSVLGGLLAFSTPAELKSPVGDYAIVPSGLTSTNYAITFLNGTLRVVDTTPPEIRSVTPSQATLWSPNHRMVPIDIAVEAFDAASAFACKVIGVTSNEPDNGLGDGDTPNDTAITGQLSVSVRAERSGRGTGRIYTITVQCTDTFDNSSSATTAVSVPHDRRR